MSISSPNHLHDVETGSSGPSDILSISMPVDDLEDSSSWLPCNTFDADLNANLYKDSVEYLNNSCKYMNDSELHAQFGNFSKTSFSLMHHNVRGMISSYTELEALVTTHQFTVVGLCETFLNEDNSSLYHFTGYHVVHKTRPNNQRGGGVSMLIKNNLNFRERNDLSTIISAAESLFIEIPKTHCNDRKTIIGEIYRPPNANKALFIDEVESLLTEITRQGSLCYLLGDINIDLMKVESDLHSADYLNCFYRHCFYPLINKPTRLSSGTLIDHMFASSGICQRGGEFSSGILFSDVSDHCPIMHISETTRSPLPNTDSARFQLINDRTIAAFRARLRNFDWSEVLNLNSAEESYEVFLKKFSDNYFECIPVIERKIKNTRKPWIDDELLRHIKEKNRLYALYIKNPCNFTRETYRTSKNRLNHLLRISERNYARDKLRDYSSCLKKQWKVINTLIERKQINPLPTGMRVNPDDALISEPREVANKLNDYFAHSGENAIRSNSRSESDPVSFVPDIANFSSMFANRISPEELLNILSNLKKSSSGVDGLKPRVVREIRHEILNPLLHVVNLSLSQGHFPSKLKQAVITPIHKKGDKTLMSNYRPISVLNVFAKVLEKLMYTRLISYLNATNVLYQRQFGFRKGHSTEMAITEAVTIITKSLNKKTPVLAVNMDLSKAFDTINHEILLKKMEKYGISGRILNWFNCYLTGRTQIVRFGKYGSISHPITRGVPQGSTLGPLLFLLYLNDIYTVSNQIDLVLYADDCNIFFKIPSQDVNFSDQVLSTLNQISEWFSCNELALNTSKTNYMIFSGRRRLQIEPVSINNVRLQRVTQCKFLGVIFDEKLTWKPHIQTTIRKLSRSNGILRKVNKNLTQNIMKQLYNSFVLPYLQYGITAWGASHKTSITRLYLTQKKAIKTALNLSPRTSTELIFRRTKFLTVAELYQLYVLLFVFKFKNSLLPACFDNYFTLAAHSHQTRNSTNFRLPLFTTNYCQQSILFQGSKLWATLPDDIKASLSIPTFKRSVKTYLMDLPSRFQ